MRRIAILLLSARGAAGQTANASISGTVLDAKTQSPIPAVLVMAVPTGRGLSGKNTRSGGDGAFQIKGLTAGKYSLCVQATGDQYLNPCQFNGSPATVTLVYGQTAIGSTLRLTAASVLTVVVQDSQKVLSQKTKDGRRPELSLGVWGPNGSYYPAHVSGGPTPTSPQFPQPEVSSHSYQIAVPRDTGLKFSIASRDLKLGDAAGAALPANASQQAFQHVTGEAHPKSFAFTLLGLLP